MIPAPDTLTSGRASTSRVRVPLPDTLTSAREGEPEWVEIHRLSPGDLVDLTTLDPHSARGDRVEAALVLGTTQYPGGAYVDVEYLGPRGRTVISRWYRMRLARHSRGGETPANR
jgi:hypothetical protein